MQNFIGIESGLALYYMIDLLMIIAVMAGMRKIAGAIGNVSSHDELTKRDNHAYGISLSGAALALAIMLMGAVSGEAANTPINEALVMLGYGGVGILLMAVTRKVFDHIALPKISIHDQIMNGNNAAALVDAGNMIATAIMLRAIMTWVDSNSWGGMLIVVAGFLLTQLLLLAATMYRRHVFAKRHGQMGLQEEIEKGNIALALRFAGHRIGIALAVTAASGMVIYGGDTGFINLAAWAGVAVIMFFALTIISIVTRKLILPGVNVADEVDNQGNVAIGAIEASTYVAVGFLLTGLFG